MNGILPRRYPPVLMYHRIGPHRGGDPALYVTEETFTRHLDWIARRGITTLSLDAAFDVLTGRRPAKKIVLLTFDDAYVETLEIAAPVLRRAGMRATVFAPSGLLGGTPDFAASYGSPDPSLGPGDGRILDASGLREWAGHGLDVGSHSVTHADLTRVDRDQVRRELNDSKSALEEILRRPVLDFCYPYAHHDDNARKEAAAAGYRTAYAGEPPHDDIHSVPRMMIRENESEARFARKLSGYYYWISAWHRRLSPVG